MSKIIRNTLPKLGTITCVACGTPIAEEWERSARLTGVTREGLTTVVHACTEECVEEYLFGGTGYKFEEVTYHPTRATGLAHARAEAEKYAAKAGVAAR